MDATRPLSMDLPSMHSYIFLESRSLRFLRSCGMILSLPAVPNETMYLVTMHFCLIHKKKISSFLSILVILYWVSRELHCFSTSKYIFFCLYIGDSRELNSGTSHIKSVNITSISLSHAVSYDAFLSFFTNRDFSFFC